MLVRDKLLVQYSGGVGSFAAAKYCVDTYGKDRVSLLFCDTKSEDEDLYRFLDDTEKFLGIPIIKIEDGRDVWEVFKDVRMIGNSQMDPCSRILKRELADKYISEHFIPEETSLVFGIDWSEYHRAKSIIARWDPYHCYFPLYEDYKGFDKNKFMYEMQTEMGIPIPSLYNHGFAHNNCGGFCIKAGKAHFLNLLDKIPERYRYHEEKELAMRNYLGKPYTILREAQEIQLVNEGSRIKFLCPDKKRYVNEKDLTVDKSLVKRVQLTTYLTLRELRERAEEIRQTEEGQTDFGGCACFA